ncbi:hypothetical protein BDF19DRAFT_430873 [Syncephalis fuscata]|nr:hypothetical protein BDF19DRAFT_430873 [Syncephalis fuscata]
MTTTFMLLMLLTMLDPIIFTKLVHLCVCVCVHVFCVPFAYTCICVYAWNTFPHDTCINVEVYSRHNIDYF